MYIELENVFQSVSRNLGIKNYDHHIDEWIEWSDTWSTLQWAKWCARRSQYWILHWVTYFLNHPFTTRQWMHHWLDIPDDQEADQ